MRAFIFQDKSHRQFIACNTRTRNITHGRLREHADPIARRRARRKVNFFATHTHTSINTSAEDACILPTRAKEAKRTHTHAHTATRIIRMQSIAPKHLDSITTQTLAQCMYARIPVCMRLVGSGSRRRRRRVCACVCCVSCTQHTRICLKSGLKNGRVHVNADTHTQHQNVIPFCCRDVYV